MELHPLRVFLTVASEKSFSRAAEKLLRTQPAISLSVQRLEAELGEKLIDRSAYLDEVIADLIKETGLAAGTRKTFKQIDVADYAKLATGPDGPGGVAKTGEGGSSSPGKLALVYAEGEIVDGEGGPGEIGAARYAREIRQLRQDNSVKAIVLRINSPGGSATASEAIQRELRLARGAKPVIVSMGDYAASGGY